MRRQGPSDGPFDGLGAPPRYAAAPAPPKPAADDRKTETDMPTANLPRPRSPCPHPRVACDGVGGALGHPRVLLEMGESTTS